MSNSEVPGLDSSISSSNPWSTSSSQPTPMLVGPLQLDFSKLSLTCGSFSQTNENVEEISTSTSSEPLPKSESFTVPPEIPASRPPFTSVIKARKLARIKKFETQERKRQRKLRKGVIVGYGWVCLPKWVRDKGPGQKFVRRFEVSKNHL